MIDDDPVPPRAADEGQWVELAPSARSVEGRRFRAGRSIWTVVEISRDFLEQSGLPMDAIAPNLRDGWLSFESDTERRRLAPIPSRWHELLPHELQALCRTATHAGRPWTPGRRKSPSQR